MDENLAAIWLTLRLAATVTLVLLLVGTPIAWWLARTRVWFKGAIAAIVALPWCCPPPCSAFTSCSLWGLTGQSVR